MMGERSERYYVDFYIGIEVRAKSKPNAIANARRRLGQIYGSRVVHAIDQDDSVPLVTVLLDEMDTGP